MDQNRDSASWTGRPARSRTAAGMTLALLAALALVAFAGPAHGGATDARARFSGSIERIDADLRARMTGSSWHGGCPVPLRRLRLLRVSHWGFDGRVKRGYLVVHAKTAGPMLGVMRKLFDRRFRIRRMRLVDAYGADDHRSMNADNTSAFNCREVAGRPGVWSEHAYGQAIDVNPVENPYVTPSGHVSPPAGRPFAVRRPHRMGMINRGGRVVRIFARAGWKWGGAWPGTKDFQHFSTSGR